MASEERTVRLTSKEGESTEVPAAVAKMSVLVRDMIDENDDDDDDEVTAEVPLPNVEASVLAKVVDFCVHYQGDPMSEIPKPLKSAAISDAVQEWYAEFVNVEQEELFELISAANYMDIKPLLDLGCAAVACKIKEKSPEEIRRLYNMVNDFNAAENAEEKEAEGIHYQGDPMNEIARPLKSAAISDAVQEWYAEFVNVEQTELFDLISAANFMDIKPLLDLGCAAVACKIKEKSPEEIRRLYNMVNDFNAAENAEEKEA
eukprot:CAMPEP_0183327090 /NCGR_PEP_ID=MMETSP0160_2-20130417/83579_1 /TAXON_ID=2839 ORGANISM="Odontella Sinensis, Strain Grunow 1884" /NCGR_SAMPLE_ID=MMETSP0160_2 /ASSEMBLY_ACC=CAM_ASM_000250 /LENGTH=259 /DNA_ID=CAMNT_0025495203 /DNA_START=67 /DNA_END=847 /DNA_ORIENTATION=+